MDKKRKMAVSCHTFSHFIDLLPCSSVPATVDAYRDNMPSRPARSRRYRRGHPGMISGVIGTLHYTVSAYSANVEAQLLVLGEHGIDPHRPVNTSMNWIISRSRHGNPIPSPGTPVK